MLPVAAQGQGLAETRADAGGAAGPNQTAGLQRRRAEHIPDFYYLHLHQQCDSALLLGGVGLNSCARPTYADPNSHKWEHKTEMPQHFQHGDELSVSCWDERYVGLLAPQPPQEEALVQTTDGGGCLCSDGIPASDCDSPFEQKCRACHPGYELRGVECVLPVQKARETLRCVNGNWVAGSGRPGLSGFHCAPCVQVSPRGTAALIDTNKQELAFFNNMKFQMSTDLLEPQCVDHNDTHVTMVDPSSCASMLIKTPELTTDEARIMQFSDGSGKCVETQAAEEGSAAVAKTCSQSDSQQMIAADEVPLLLWNLLRFTRPTGQWTTPYKSLSELSGHAQCAPDGAIGAFTPGARGADCRFAPVAHLYDSVLLKWHGVMEISFKTAKQQDFANATSDEASVKYRIPSCSVGGLKGTADMICHNSDTNSIAVNTFREGRVESRLGEVLQFCDPPRILGTADLNGDGVADLTCSDPTGASHKAYFMEHGRPVGDVVVVRRDWCKRDGGIVNWADMDGDRTDDMVCSNQLGEHFVILIRNGQVHGNLGEVKSGWCKTSGARTKTGDVNGDGHADLICDLPNGQHFAQLMRGGKPLKYLGKIKSKWCAGDVSQTSYADVNGDGTDDMVCAKGDGNHYVILLKDGLVHKNVGKVRENWCYQGPDYRKPAIRYADMTGDGIVDMVCDHPYGYQTIVIMGKDGNSVTRTPWLAENERFCKEASEKLITADVDGAVYPRCNDQTSWIDFPDDTEKKPRPGTEYGERNTYYWSYSGKAFNRLDIKHKGSWVVSEMEIDGVEVPNLHFTVLKDPPLEIGNLRIYGTRWAHELAATHVKCGPGQALVSLGVSAVGIRYQCAVISGLGACIPWYTDQVDVAIGIEAIASMHMVCEGEHLLAGFLYEHSDAGDWGRFQYTCCASGGAPTIADPYETSSGEFHAATGLYCPTHMDHSETLLYQRRSTPSNDNAPRELKFNPGSGEWCLGEECQAMESLSPVGLKVSGVEVTPVLDFAGEFEGKGVSTLGMASGDAEGVLAALKKPTRPKPPKAPKLEVFEPEQPEYAMECKFDQFNYPTETALWDSVSDAQGEHELMYAENEEELPAGNPCQVAAGEGGTEDKMQGGDGQLHTNLDYSAISGCSTRGIMRGAQQSRQDIRTRIFELVADGVEAYVKVGCAAAPNAVVAPVGVGVEMSPPSICAEVTEMVRTVVSGAREIADTTETYLMEKADAADCDPIQVGFSRLFCDIHCVRDAVIRGDMTINRNLKQATDITNRNAKALAKWSTDTTISQTDWLAEKIDYVDAKMTIKIDALGKKVKEVKTLAEAAAAAKALMAEVKGMASDAGVRGATRASGQRALQSFVATVPEVHDGNMTEALTFISAVHKLHASMAAATRLSATGRTSAALVLGAREMDHLLNAEIHTLGVYRQASDHAKKNLRGLGNRAQAMMTLDSLWWKLRGEFDEYVDSAEDQIKTYQEAFSLLAGYRHCSVGFSEIKKAYARTESARVVSHKKLRTTWRSAVNSLGELASVIVDGDVFTSLLNESCDTTQAEQTMMQFHTVVSGVRMLQARFVAGALQPPDAAPVLEAAHRVQAAYDTARQACN